jgi:hypothetical protein
MSRFIASDTGKAFIKCDGKIKNKTDFDSISPYSSNGPKFSNYIFNSEIGAQSARQQKKYFGQKPYIVSRIAYNKCSARPEDQIWQKYRDVSSHDEAFNKANQMFHGMQQIPIRSIRSIPSRTEFDRPTSQLLSEDEYKQFYATATSASSASDVIRPIEIKDLQAHNVEQFMSRQRPRPLERPRERGRPLERGREQDYIPYANTNIYIQCPSRDSINLEDMKKRLSEYKIKQAALGNNLQGKTVYCGTEIQDIVKAKMCGLINNDDIKDFDLQELGSPGQCFEYGKIYKTPLKHSYMFYTHDYT